MKHLMMSDYSSCASQFKRGKMSYINNEQYRLLCYDILCKDESLSIPSSFSDEEKKDKLLIVLVSVLSQLISRGDKLRCTHKQFRSSSGRLPPIGLESYIARLLQYAPCDRECFISALLYMDRLSDRCGFVFNSMNIHRAYLTALLIAAKFFEDQPCDNAYFATVGGVSTHEMNNLEIQFLSLTEFRVTVTTWEYNLYSQLVEEKSQTIGSTRTCRKEIQLTPDTTATTIMMNPEISVIST